MVSSLPKPNDSLTTVSQRCSGAYALMDSLKRHGVKHIFGYPGGAILPIYDELYRFEERGCSTWALESSSPTPCMIFLCVLDDKLKAK
ncbi:MAG: thiamine pyrophosphate-binding protein, partial [Microcystis panniformis]